MFTEQVEWEELWGRLTARAWTDDAFRQRLLAEPAAVLAEHGVQAPAGVSILVVENTANQINLVLPARPSREELSEEELGQAVGGAACTSSCNRCRSCRRPACGCGGCSRCTCSRPQD